MKRIGLFLLAVLFGCNFLLAVDSDSEQQLRERAHQKTFFPDDEIPSFHQTVRFTIHVSGKPAITGDFQRDYLDSKHDRRRMTAGDYDSSHVRNDGTFYFKASDPITPPVLGAIEGFVPPPVLLPHPLQSPTASSRVFLKTPDAASLECFQLDHPLEIYCVNAEGQVAKQQRADNTVEFSGFKDFGGKQIPTHFELISANGTHVSGDIETTAAPNLAVTMFQPPPSAGFEETTSDDCKAGKPPKVLTSQDPKMPPQGALGTTVLWMVVGVDGKPHEIKVARSLSFDNDMEAAKAVSNWTFKPAECAGKPAARQINVEVNFVKSP